MSGEKQRTLKKTGVTYFKVLTMNSSKNNLVLSLGLGFL